MREFFRGWKCKVGVLTLLMACVFIAGWVRSTHLEDRISIHFRKHATLLFIMSQDGLAFIVTPPRVTYTGGDYLESSNTFNYRKFSKPVFKSKSYDITLFYGFGYNRFSDGRPQETIAIIVPYWSIVLPLTAISTYLLLSKPRLVNRSESPIITAK